MVEADNVGQRLSSFYERPILNSPYRVPKLHHPLDKHGQPLEGEPTKGRRPSRLIVPVPASRKKALAAHELETYTEHALINEIRGYVDRWRALRNPADWGVTGVSQRLLDHWRNHQFAGSHPLLLPTGSRRDDHLADGGCVEACGIKGTSGSDREGQRRGEPGPFPHRLENGDGQRQDDRHGHAGRLAGGERRPQGVRRIFLAPF